VAKSAAAPASSERAQYLGRLFAKRAAPTDDTAPLAPVNKAHDRLMAMAKRAHDADPTRTPEQHYAAIAEAKPALLRKAVRVTLDWDDDQDDEDDADSLGDDPDEPDYPELDASPAAVATAAGRPAPTPAEARTNSGRSEAPYNNQGDNLRQTPKPAVMGAVEGSYDPARRPASATRKALNAAVERRVAKFMAKHPGASRVEATSWATRGRKVQRLLNAS
jgi:hypothetical protein